MSHIHTPKFVKHHWLLIAAVILVYIYRQRLLSLFAQGKASLRNTLSTGLLAAIPTVPAAKDGGTANKTPAVPEAWTVRQIVDLGAPAAKEAVVDNLGPKQLSASDLSLNPFAEFIARQRRNGDLRVLIPAARK